MAYWCEGCEGYSREAACRECGALLPASSRDVDACLPEIALPESGVLDTALVLGHWGDSFFALSSAKMVLDRLGQEKCNILYCGPDPNVVEYIIAQPWTHEVRGIISPGSYKWITKELFASDRKNNLWYQGLVWAAPPNIDVPERERVWTAGIPSFRPDLQFRVHPCQGVLPAKRRGWASAEFDGFLQEIGERPVLLHPSSTWSCQSGGHWPHWEEAIEWLLDKTNKHFILTGLNPWPGARHERLHDWTGQLPSNMENLALAEYCGKVITTCNSVALWAAMQGVPALVLGNDALTMDFGPFKRFIDREPNYLLPVEAALDDFLAAAGELLETPITAPKSLKRTWSGTLPDRRVVPDRAPQAVPCKVCRHDAPLFGVVDFHKNCEMKRPGMRGPLPLSGIPVYYHRCEKCGLIFTRQFDLWDPGDWTAFVYNDDYELVDPEFDGRRSKRDAATLSGLFGEGYTGRVLDYGGGGGHLARLLRERHGWTDVTVYDPFVAEFATEPKGKFSLITAFEVLEHAPDPQWTFSDMRHRLYPGGTLLASTLCPPLAVTPDHWYIAPRNGHVTIYTDVALESLARDNWLEYRQKSGLHFFNDGKGWPACL